MIKQVIKNQAGFTQVELVIVIIILGVLSVTALPKFMNKSNFEDYTVQDQLIARLRLVQLQGMNADIDKYCYWLVIKDTCFYSEETTKIEKVCSDPSSSGVCQSDSFNSFNPVSFPLGMLSERNFNFDSQGKLIGDKTPISIEGDNNLSVIIESEGFIHD